MNSTQKRALAQIENHKKGLLAKRSESSLTQILNSEPCQKLLNECREYRERIYTPVKTLFMFIKQVLNSDKSCQKAVSGTVTEQISAGKSTSSTNTGPYCKARKRLPEETVHALVKETGKQSLSGIRAGWKIYGRETKLVDGSMLLMPDTPENQKQFPQHGNQKKGAGFPLARLVVVMSLTVGSVIDYAIGANKGKGTGEHSLFRLIQNCIEKDDILLGDCYYPSFF